LYKRLKDTKIKNHPGMFRILCDPSSGSTELCLTEITRSDSQIFCGVLGRCLAAQFTSEFKPQNISTNNRGNINQPLRRINKIIDMDILPFEEAVKVVKGNTSP
jgi:hypothetical protein